MAHAPTSVTRHFAALPDPRVERTKEHVRLDLLTIARCAVICGADSFVGMVTFAEEKAPWLRSFLPLPQGLPSHDTFGRVVAALDPEAFQRCFLAWVHGVAPGTAGQVVPVDGKTLRGARDRGRGRAALHLVSAWASASRLVLGQVAVAEQSNAITAIPALLRLLDLTGATVTIDALGCQTAIAAQIVAQGADDALARKDNHPTLHDDVRRTFEAARADAFAVYAPTDHDHVRMVEQGHGRLEIRRHWTRYDAALLADLDPAGAWAKRGGSGLVERERRADGRVTVEQHYSLLSAPLTAAAFAAAVRRHWGIENRGHWLRDVTFREDGCRARVGHAARNLAVLRHLARNLLRQERTCHGSLPTKRFKAALSEDYLGRVLAPLADHRAVVAR